MGTAWSRSAAEAMGEVETPMPGLESAGGYDAISMELSERGDNDIVGGGGR